MSVQIARTADDKKQGMSVGDVRLFLAEVDRAGLDDTAQVKAVVGFKMQLQKLAAEG